MTVLVRLIIACISVASGSVFASVDCFSKSPRLAEQGDSYWQINTVAPASIQGKNQFLTQAQAFSGRVTGNLQHEECSGTVHKPLVKSTKASVKGAIVVQGDAVQFILETTDNKEKIVKTERMEFLGRSPTVDFAFSADGTFHLQQKLRANATPGDKISLLREAEYSISFNKKQLTMRAVYYANGFYYAEDSWVILRR
ncbi:MAG TPA: hypothetical protein VIZ65_16795 [Cellvibrionaceae bacterium]